MNEIVTTLKSVCAFLFFSVLAIWLTDLLIHIVAGIIKRSRKQ